MRRLPRPGAACDCGAPPPWEARSTPVESHYSKPFWSVLKREVTCILKHMNTSGSRKSHVKSKWNTQKRDTVDICTCQIQVQLSNIISQAFQDHVIMEDMPTLHGWSGYDHYTIMTIFHHFPFRESLRQELVPLRSPDRSGIQEKTTNTFKFGEINNDIRLRGRSEAFCSALFD